MQDKFQAVVSICQLAELIKQQKKSLKNNDISALYRVLL